MSRLQRALPWIVLSLGIAYALSLAIVGVGGGGGSGGFDWDAAGRIPISADGRVKPLDTFARNNLLLLSGRQTYDVDGRQAPAIQWLVELISNQQAAGDRRVFRIDHPDVVALLGVPDPKRTRFSYNEIGAHFTEITRQAELASSIAPKQRDPFQKAMAELDLRLTQYYQIAQMEMPYVIAPLAAGEDWRPDPVDAKDGPKAHPSSKALAAIRLAYSHGDSATFNTEVNRYLELVRGSLSGESRRAGYEVILNRMEPFYQSAVLYVLAFVLACLGFLMGSLTRPGWFHSLSRSALAVLGVAFAIQTLGLISRIYLQGRPPVTNLYSSAVFIGWACIPMAIAVERFFKLGIGTIAASLIGFTTLIIAHNLSGGGDTMEMMQAVLDSNFWLSTHVVVVTLGYSATFLAGFIAGGYILLGVLTPLLRGEPMKAMPKMVYGMICFACVTSFVGTVLGGIWADQSWGRFWGWDPKENGAVLIVLMNVLILHARWGGMIRDRGVAVLAVGGNIVTAWSWFGTNMLGVGLHSYGFMDSAVFWLIAFCVSQLVVMAVASVPQKSWRSVRPPPERRSKAAEGLPKTSRRAKPVNS
jgi:ABC-type transport system involved in cytochrome c biogenesis permease subunit